MRRLADFVVRWPWAVIGVWVAMAVALPLTLPSLNEMADKHPLAILPSDAPSAVTARKMTEAFHESGSEDLLLVVLTNEKGLGPADEAAYRKLVAALPHARHDRLPPVLPARPQGLDAIPDAKATVIETLLARLDLVQGDYSDQATWTGLCDALDLSESEISVTECPPHDGQIRHDRMRSRNDPVLKADRERLVLHRNIGRSRRAREARRRCARDSCYAWIEVAGGGAGNYPSKGLLRFYAGTCTGSPEFRPRSR